MLARDKTTFVFKYSLDLWVDFMHDVIETCDLEIPYLRLDLGLGIRSRVRFRIVQQIQGYMILYLTLTLTLTLDLIPNPKPNLNPRLGIPRIQVSITSCIKFARI